MGLTAFYVVTSVQARNVSHTGIQNAIYALSAAIILLFIHLCHRLYFRAMDRVRILIDHYIEDMVADKLKQKQYAETLNKDEIHLFIAGWCRECIPSLYIPLDVITLCALYLSHKQEQRKRIVSYSSVQSLFFSFSNSLHME